MNHIKESALEEGVNSELSTRNRRQFIEIASLAAAYSVYAGCGGNEMTGPSRVDPPTTVPPTTEPPTTTPTPQAPIFLNHMPTGELPAGTKEYPISVDTIDDTVARFALQPDFRYEDMVNLFTTTGTKRHETILRNLNNGQEITVNVRGKDVLTGVTNMADYRWTFHIATPDTIDIPIVGLFTGANAGNGIFTINGLSIPIENGLIKITKEMVLPPGQYVAGPITTDIGMPRYAIVDYDGNTMSVNLGGGRTESPLNVIEKGHIDLNDFARYALRGVFVRGAIDRPNSRITEPLKIGLLDQFGYSLVNGSLRKELPITIDPTTRSNLYNIVRNFSGRNDASYWTDGLYPPGDLLASSHFYVQSMGHSIPETGREPGWIIIFPHNNINPANWIEAGDSTQSRTNTPTRIIWARLGFNQQFSVPEGAFFTDLHQSWGWAEQSETQIIPQTLTTRMYALLKYARPPGFTIADGTDRATSYNPSTQGFFGVLEGISRIFKPAF